MIEAQQARSQEQGAWVPPGPQPLKFEVFSTLNTKPSRAGIETDQMYISDGFMPLGVNNLRTLPGIGASIYTAPSGKTIIWYYFGNIGATPICIVLLSDGSLVQVNTNTGATTVMGAAGTIGAVSASLIGASQWGNTFVVIVNQQTNGLFIWDGTNLFKTGTLAPDITYNNSGSGYTSAPTTAVWGGIGTGAVVSATVSDGGVSTVSITNPGTGYSSNDVPIVVFSGGGSLGKTAKLTTAIASGTVSSVSISDPGAGYSSTAVANFVGGGGVGAQASVTVTGTSIASVAVTYGGVGYTSAPTCYIHDGSSAVAEVVLNTMPSGISATDAEAFQNRIWLVNSATTNLYCSAAELLTDFAANSGGVITPVNESFLNVGLFKVVQTNGVLYVVADSCIDAVSGVNQSGTPPTTTFSLQNVDPENGSPWVNSVGTLNRNVILANPNGIFICAGSNVIKISDQLDGIYSSADIGGFSPSSAKATIFGRRVWMLLKPIVDQVTKQSVNKLLMTDGKTWWTSQQDVNLQFIAGQKINSVFTAYGTDGTNIYPLFYKPSTVFTKTYQTKLHNDPTLAIGKTASRLWGAVQYYSANSPNITVSVDSEKGASSNSYPIAPNVVTFTNNAGNVIAFTNNIGASITWYALGTGLVIFPPTAVGQQGVYLGLTVSTNCADVALISLELQPEIWEYRG